MGRLIKWLVIVVGFIVLALAAAAVALPFLVDPNDYKDEIANAVKKNTGRDLTIDGDLGLSVFPWVGINTGRLALANAPGFGADPLAQVDEVDVKVKLMPLLRKQLEVNTVALHGLTLNLVTNAAGRTNWQDLAGAKAAKPEAAEAEAGVALAAIAVQGVDVRDGRVVWDDRKAGSKYLFDKIQLTTGKIVSGKPAQVSLDLEAEGGGLPNRVPLELDTTVKLDVDAQTVSLGDLKLALKDLPAKLALAVPSVDVALKKQTLQVPSFAVEFGELNAQGSLSGNSIIDAPRFKGEIDVPEFALRNLLASLGTEVQTADAKALARASLRGKLSGTLDKIRVQDLTATLDDSKLTGELELGLGAKSVYKFNLNVDQIDLDRYLSPAAEAKTTAEAVPGEALVALPVAPLRGMDAQGDFRIQTFKISGLSIADMHIGVSSVGGNLKVAPIRAKLYEGALDGSLGVDARSDTPRFQIAETLTGVKLGPLLQDAGISDKLTGRGQVSLNVAGQGATADALMRSLSGEAPFALRDGAIKGLNIRKLVIQAKQLAAKAEGKEYKTEADEKDEFQFTEMTGTLRFGDGLVRNDDLAMKSPLFRVAGKGKASLIDETIDYTLNVTVVESSKGQGGAELQDLKGVTIPIRVAGNLHAPSYGIDFGALVQKQLEKKIEEKLEKKLDKKLGKELDKLFGR